MKWKIMAVILVLMASMASSMAVAIPGTSTSPTESLPYNLDQKVNITPSDTVVLVVADPSDNAVKALADVVANKLGAPVLLTPTDKLDLQVIDTLTALMKYNGLEDVVIIGTDKNTTDIASLVAQISDSETNTKLTVSYVVYSSDIATLSQKVAYYFWENATSLVLTDYTVHEDLAKATAYAAVNGLPMLYEQLGATLIDDTCTNLGVTTIYTTPAVDPEVNQSLIDAGYTINGTAINTSTLIYGYAPTSAVFVVAKEDDTTPYDQLFDVLGYVNVSNSGYIVANSSEDLGTDASSILTGISSPLVILFGDLNVIEEPLATEIASKANTTPWRLVYTDTVDKFARATLVAEAYVYPVLTVSYTSTDNHYEYTFRNFGFSDVIVYSNASVRVTFHKDSGQFVDSSIEPFKQNDTVVIYLIPDPIYPSSSYKLSFNVTEGTKFDTIPELSYYAYTTAGTIKPLESITYQVIEYFSTTFEWFTDMFKNLVGFFEGIFEVVMPSILATALAIAIVFLILWSLVGAAAYVIIKYIMGKRIGSKFWYGLIVWFVKE